MIKRTGGWPDRGLLEALVLYLDNPEDQAQVWRGLQFMEANEIDLSLRYDELHGYLTSATHSPIEDAPALSHEDERAIVLALRNIIRRDLGLPALTEVERAAWKYERLEPLGWPPEKLISKVYGETYQPSQKDVIEISEELSKTSPELMRALILFTEHNVSVDEQCGKVQSTLWLNTPLKRLISKYRSELSAIDVANCAYELSKRIWKSIKK